MSIWVNQNSKILVQGITGKAARLHTEAMLAYGTQVVAGVSPGKGGLSVLGVPVFDTVQAAMVATQADVTVIFVPAPHAMDALVEAIDANVSLIVCITEHIPIHDMLFVKNYMIGKPVRLIGPNCPGIIAPDLTKIGIMPGEIHKKGHIGIVSRSGTLTYEAVSAVTRAGYGQSTAIGIGGDPIHGVGFIDVLEAFEADSDTHAIVLIGEIGGDAEEKVALWAKAHLTKPMVAFISGTTAPEGKQMGHAGAIVSGAFGTANSKIRAFKQANIPVAKRISDIVPLLLSQM